MSKKENIFKIDPNLLDDRVIKKSSKILEKGGLLALPAKSYYGLSADAFNEKSVDKIFEIKKRSLYKPLLILIEDLSLVDHFAKKINKTAKRVMEKFWPGNITLVFDAKKSVHRNITGGGSKIGIRVPQNRVSRAILKCFKGKAITSTSLNISGEKPVSSIAEIDKSFLRKIDIVLDVGKLPTGELSTVLDISNEDFPLVLREGSIKKKVLLKFIKGE